MLGTCQLAVVLVEIRLALREAGLLVNRARLRRAVDCARLGEAILHCPGCGEELWLGLILRSRRCLSCRALEAVRAHAVKFELDAG